MLDTLIVELKGRAGHALGQTMLAVVVGLALAAASGLLCAALVIAVMQHYGAVAGCVVGAALYLAVALVAGGWYAYRRRLLAAQQAAAARAAHDRPLTDPLLVALELIRTGGARRLLPLLALGGLAVGLMMRGPSDKRTGRL